MQMFYLLMSQYFMPFPEPDYCSANTGWHILYVQGLTNAFLENGYKGIYTELEVTCHNGFHFLRLSWLDIFCFLPKFTL